MTIHRPSRLFDACLFILWIWRPGAGQEHILFVSEHSLMPLCSPVAAMGDAGVALPIGAAGLYHNPAIPSLDTARQLWAEGARLYGGLSNQGMVSLGMPIQEGTTVAVMYSAFFPGDIPLQLDTLPGSALERLDNPSLRARGGNDGVFHDNHHLLIASLSRRFPIPLPRPAGFSFPLPLDIAVGLNAKYAWQTMTIAEKVRMGMNANIDAGVLVALGVDFDVARRRTSRQVLFAAAVRNAVPTSMIWVHSPEGYREPVDNAQYYGMSYVDDEGISFLTWKCSLALLRLLAGRSTPADSTGAATASTVYTSSYHFGAAVGLWNIIEVRAGISDRVPTMGAAIRYRNWSLDYAFRFDQIQYSPVRLSVSVGF